MIKTGTGQSGHTEAELETPPQRREGTELGRQGRRLTPRSRGMQKEGELRTAGSGNTHEIPGRRPGMAGRKKPVGRQCSRSLRSDATVASCAGGGAEQKMTPQPVTGKAGAEGTGEEMTACGILFVLLGSQSGKTEPQVTATSQEGTEARLFCESEASQGKNPGAPGWLGQWNTATLDLGVVSSSRGLGVEDMT